MSDVDVEKTFGALLIGGILAILCVGSACLSEVIILIVLSSDTSASVESPKPRPLSISGYTPAITSLSKLWYAIRLSSIPPNAQLNVLG